MTHAPETGDSIYLAPVNFWYVCKSDTGFVLYQIPAPIRTLLHSKLEIGVPVTNMNIYDLFLFKLSLDTLPAIIIAAASANSSSTSLSAMFTSIFGARNFHSGLANAYMVSLQKTGTENRHQKMESIYSGTEYITIYYRLIYYLVVNIKDVVQLDDMWVVQHFHDV